MADYEFVTEWRIDAPVDAVWAAIFDSLRWPQWWRAVRRVEELAPGDADGIGNLRRYTFRSVLPYNLVFDMRTTRIEPLRALDGAASGELEGEGRWRFKADAGGTLVRYEWDVRTTRAWMNALAPIARPLFTWNHEVVMRQGETGLRRHLGVP
jgi:uncharacterized protein YndB with AHSA1/START domain